MRLMKELFINKTRIITSIKYIKINILVLRSSWSQTIESPLSKITNTVTITIFMIFQPTKLLLSQQLHIKHV